MLNIELRGLNFCTTSGALATSGNVTTYNIGSSINYVIDGIIATKAAVTNGVTPTTDYVTGAAFPPLLPNYGCVVVWALTANGTVVCMMGRHFQLDSQGNFVVAPQLPAVPNSCVPFAYQVLKTPSTGPASGLTFGTSQWSAFSASTPTNVAVLPARPKIS